MYASQRSLGRSLDSDEETVTTEQTEEESLQDFQEYTDKHVSPRTTETSSKSKKGKFSLANSFRLNKEQKEERKESLVEEIKEENLPDSLNPLIKYASINPTGGAAKQKQKYCMLCFKEFKMMSKKKQCCFCRKVVCKTCSVK